MSHWHILDHLVPCGLATAIQNNIEIERYHVQFLSLGWDEKAWDTLIAWIKQNNFNLFGTLEWAKRAASFGVSLPESLDMNEWEEKVGKERIKHLLGVRE